MQLPYGSANVKKPENLAASGPSVRIASGDSGVLGVEELLVFGRALQCGGRSLTLDRRRHGIEVTGADFALVLDRGEALLGRREFLFLQLDEGAHVVARIAVGQVEHAVVQR